MFPSHDRVAVFSLPIVNIIFGIDYLPAVLILKVMSVRLIFCHAGVARGVYLLCENFLKYSTVTMVIGTIVNIFLNYFLIPEYGAVGATIASLVSFFITIYCVDLMYYKTRLNSILMLKSVFSCFIWLKSVKL